MARQKPYFHVSYLKEYRENDPNRFKSRRMDKPARILIDNAEEWEAEQILDYRYQNNRHQFCNMCTCSGNGTQERAVQDLLCLVDLYLVYLI